jgi:hypothetical protein
VCSSSTLVYWCESCFLGHLVGGLGCEVSEAKHIVCKRYDFQLQHADCLLKERLVNGCHLKARKGFEGPQSR